jgi:predicted transcriptional regulator
MRLRIDLPDDQLAELTRLAQRENVSRASLARQAISDLLAAKRRTTTKAAFGLWTGMEDGLVIQQRLRDEWPP